jgi:protein ImuB
MLWLCLHLPDLALDVCTRASAAPEPLVVCDGRGREERVLRANAAAAQHGVRIGQRVSAARALVCDLRVRARERAAEDAALAAIAAWAGQFSSRVSLAPPQEVLLEIGASLRLFRGLTPLLAQVELGLAQLGYAAQLAVAPTPLAATWLARVGGDAQVTEPGALAPALAPLPLEVTALAPDQLARLHGMGVHSIGDCARLPRAGLARRLGTDVPALLDRAHGHAADPRAPFVAPATFVARLALPGAVETVEAVVFALNRLVLELCGLLRARGSGVRALDLSLVHVASAVTPVHLDLVAATQDARHLTDLWRERLARVALAQPVEALVLEAASFIALHPPTLDLFAPRQPASESAHALTERLRARLGPQAVQGLRVLADHRPERAYGYAPTGGDDTGAAGGAVAGAARPLWLLPQPLLLPAHAGQPWMDGALQLEGEAERIESGWWDGQDAARDYFAACNGRGERYWVFRELHAPQRWWLHGVFG